MSGGKIKPALVEFQAFAVAEIPVAAPFAYQHDERGVGRCTRHEHECLLAAPKRAVHEGERRVGLRDGVLCHGPLAFACGVKRRFCGVEGGFGGAVVRGVRAHGIQTFLQQRNARRLHHLRVADKLLLRQRHGPAAVGACNARRKRGFQITLPICAFAGQQVIAHDAQRLLKLHSIPYVDQQRVVKHARERDLLVEARVAQFPFPLLHSAGQDARDVQDLPIFAEL